jgi:hypothetical protein
VQEIVAETQTERNKREKERYFREQPAEQNSSPVDCCATHFPTPVRHLERSAIVATSDETNPSIRNARYGCSNRFLLLEKPIEQPQPVLPKLNTTMSNRSFVQLRLNSMQFFNSAHSQRDVIQADIFLVIR